MEKGRTMQADRIWEKSEQLICPEIRYRTIGESIMITGCYGVDGQVVLPDEIEGKPVTALAPYIFAVDHEDEGDEIWLGNNADDVSDRHRICGSELTEVWLPLQTTEIGRYAFYRCRNLTRLNHADSLLDMGGGALTGCRVSDVEIHFLHGKKSCLKSIVDEMRYQIRAVLLYYEEGKEARILFPEHYEEAVENTPARILVTHHHGVGGYYRQCFYDRELDYKKYDEMLYHAIAEEEMQTTAELVLNRLMYPYDLGVNEKMAYQQWLRDHVEEVARCLVQKETFAGLTYLGDEGFWTEYAMDVAVEEASKEKNFGIVQK